MLITRSASAPSIPERVAAWTVLVVDTVVVGKALLLPHPVSMPIAVVVTVLLLWLGWPLTERHRFGPGRYWTAAAVAGSLLALITVAAVVAAGWRGLGTVLVVLVGVGAVVALVVVVVAAGRALAAAERSER